MLQAGTRKLKFAAEYPKARNNVAGGQLRHNRVTPLFCRENFSDGPCRASRVGTISGFLMTASGRVRNARRRSATALSP